VRFCQSAPARQQSIETFCGTSYAEGFFFCREERMKMSIIGEIIAELGPVVADGVVEVIGEIVGEGVIESVTPATKKPEDTNESGLTGLNLNNS
jgi:hypothetical protein